MISKICYSKLLKEDLRHHITTITVNIVALFLHILYFAMGLQNKLEEGYGDAAENVAEFCEPSFTFGVIVALLGVYAAIEGFQFLHSKRKMDFYGALPITRGKKFGILSTNQVLMFAIPLVIHTVLRVIFVAMTGYGTTEAYTKLVYSGLFLLATFLVAWATAVLAMVATGNAFVAIFGINVVLWYVPLVRFILYDGFRNTFFMTYVGSEIPDFWYCFSPATIISRLFVNWEEVTWSIKNHGVWLLPLMIWIIALVVLSYVLYQKRTTETAGKATAFARFNPILRFVIVVPLALSVGLLLCLMSMSAGPIWAFIGIAVGCVLMHAVMEGVLEFDARMMFRHKWSLAGELVVALAIMSVFAFDLMGYDTYIPKASDLKAVVVNWGDDYEGYSLEEVKKAKQMPEEVIEDALYFATQAMEGKLEEPEEDQEIPEDKIYLHSYVPINYGIEVNYVLKDGTVRQRAYTIGESFDFSIVESFFNTKEYKQSMDWVVDEWFHAAESMILYDITADRKCEFTKEEKAKLAQAYKKDYENLTYEEFRTKSSGVLYGIEVDDDATRDYGMSRRFPIYLSYENTREVLKECGEKLLELEDVTITELQIVSYETTEDVYVENLGEGVKTETTAIDMELENKRVYIDDVKIIEKYRDKLSASYLDFYKDEEQINYEIYAYVDFDGEEHGVDYGVNLYASPEICAELMELGTPLE